MSRLLTFGLGPVPVITVEAPAPPPSPSPGNDTLGAIALLTADVVDDDTEQAVLALWARAQLSSLFQQPPRTGRLYSTQPAADLAATGPYVVLDCRLGRRELVGADAQGLAPWNDYRAVTMTVYGQRGDVVRGISLITAVFNRKLGAPHQPTLVYPSGARFMRWWPEGNAKIEEDQDSKAGKDVWRGIIEAEVWSIRDN